MQTTTGGVTSITVAIAEQVEEFPLPSVMVRTTVFAPRLAQVNVFGVKLAVKTVQLSPEPTPTTEAPSEPLPTLLRVPVAFEQTAVGAIKSRTVTVAEQVLLLPLTSVTVRMTELAPKLAQVKLLLFRVVVAMPQASFEPLLTAEAVVLPLPALFKFTVTFWQIAFGACTSFTVTVKLQVAEPHGFVAVIVTVVVPRLKVVPEPVPVPEPVVAPESV